MSGTCPVKPHARPLQTALLSCCSSSPSVAAKSARGSAVLKPHHTVCRRWAPAMSQNMTAQSATAGIQNRHCLCLVLPRSTWPTHCLCLVFPLHSRRRHCLCLLFLLLCVPLPSRLRHRLYLLRPPAFAAKTLPLLLRPPGRRGSWIPHMRLTGDIGNLWSGKVGPTMRMVGTKEMINPD